MNKNYTTFFGFFNKKTNSLLGHTPINSYIFPAFFCLKVGFIFNEEVVEIQDETGATRSFIKLDPYSTHIFRRKDNGETVVVVLKDWVPDGIWVRPRPDVEDLIKKIERWARQHDKNYKFLLENSKEIILKPGMTENAVRIAVWSVEGIYSGETLEEEEIKLYSRIQEPISKATGKRMLLSSVDTRNMVALMGRHPISKRIVFYCRLDQVERFEQMFGDANVINYPIKSSPFARPKKTIKSSGKKIAPDLAAVLPKRMQDDSDDTDDDFTEESDDFKYY
jgi:hypothetical protein